MAGGLQGATVGVSTASSGVNAGGIGNIQLMSPPVNSNANVPVNTNAGTPTTDTSGGLGSLLGSLIGGAANVYGAQNAAENISRADTAAINTQTQTLGNINNLFTPQTTLGNNAMSTLGSSLGTNGQPANYSNFLNMPGYQFAVQQGTQAIQRQAAAAGNAWTPNTGAAIGQYVTGTAMQDYNTYINQLQNAAGLGAQANNTLSGANLTVGGNISQLLQNSGMAQASGVNNASGTIGNFLNRYGGTIGNNVVGGIGNIAKGVGNWFSGGNTSGVNTGTDAFGGYYDAGGNYIPAGANLGGGGNTPGDMNTGYDNSQTDFSQSAGDYGGPG